MTHVITNQIASARQGWSVLEYGIKGKSKGNGKDGDLLFFWSWSKENVSQLVCKSIKSKLLFS